MLTWHCRHSKCFTFCFSQFGLPDEMDQIIDLNLHQKNLKSFAVWTSFTIVCVHLRPATNGEADLLYVFKEKVHPFQSKNWQHNIANFLLNYRTTPHSATSCTHSELLFNHTVYTKWNLLNPSNTLINFINAGSHGKLRFNKTNLKQCSESVKWKGWCQ